MTQSIQVSLADLFSVVHAAASFVLLMGGLGAERVSLVVGGNADRQDWQIVPLAFDFSLGLV